MCSFGFWVLGGGFERLWVEIVCRGYLCSLFWICADDFRVFVVRLDGVEPRVWLQVGEKVFFWFWVFMRRLCNFGKELLGVWRNTYCCRE